MTNPALSGGGKPLQIAYFVTVFVVLAILAVAVAREVSGGSHVTEITPEAAPAPQSRAPELQELVCFTCHGLTSFREGGDGAFPHEFHFDMVGVSECHYCHAFNVHEPVINRQDCEMCH